MIKASVIIFSLLYYCPGLAQNNSILHGSDKSTSVKTFPLPHISSTNTLEELNDYDVKYYGLNLNVSNLDTEISGDATIYAQVKASMLDTFCIELIDTVESNAGAAFMIVDSVRVDNKPADYIHENNLIKIDISPSLPLGSYFFVRIFYHGDGNGPVSNATAFNSSITLTESEPFGSMYWFPCKQVLTDKADSTRVVITTSSDCLAGSNGILKSVTALPDNKIRYEWVSHYPIAYYLISFAVGPYKDYKTYAHLNNSEDSVLIQSYLISGSPYLNTQLVAIEKTKENMQFYSNLFGTFPFADEKYGYCVDNRPYYGMENQTMTTLGYLLIDTSMSNLNQGFLGWSSAHELSHSWFGDDVTCGTWQDIWVNEGFAEYCEYLAIYYNDSHENGDEFITFLQDLAKYYPDGSVYVPAEYADDADRILDPTLSYGKGAAILHTIRFMVDNDSLFFQTLRNYETKFAHGNATGLDFKAVLDSTTGMDFTDFFDEWYFGEGYPTFNIYFNQQNDTLNFRSVQTTSSLVTPLFKVPVELELFYAGGDTTIRYFQKVNDIDFSLISHHQITRVEFDPNHWLIADNVMHVTSVTDNPSEIRTYSLSQNYPNPFNPATKIKFEIARTGFVELQVYDVLGRTVATLVDEVRPAGKYEEDFDGSNLSSGIYFYSLSAGSFRQVKKMILLK